ncbi:MAG: nucleotidyltransferase family protein, partial [Nitrospiraceae bacterium]
MSNLMAQSAMWSRVEHEIAVCCARISLGSDTASRLRTLFRQSVDWLYLLRLARQHGMTPLLYRHLSGTCADMVPKAVLDQLGEAFKENLQNNLLLTAELLTLMQMFERQGIAAVPYKGPVLAVSVYGNLALRQFRDLDIFVHKRDALKARDLLIERGYRPEFPLIGNQDAVYLRT